MFKLLLYVKFVLMRTEMTLKESEGEKFVFVSTQYMFY